MIKFNLKCSDDHGFESWFKSNDSYESLQSSGLVGCPFCGSTDIEKAIMAPHITSSRNKAAAPSEPLGNMHALTAPASEAETAVAELKKKIQETSEYVGSDFAAEARAIHDGDAPERSIYGEADARDAKQLIEDGVPVAPLPFMPTRKTN